MICRMLFLLFLGALPQMMPAQNTALLAGTWQMPQAGITLEFDAAGNYVVTYANGQSVQERYSLQGNQLTMSRFYYGQDQHFQIVQLDQQTLVLQALDGQPGMQFSFQRAGAAPAAGGFAQAPPANTYPANPMSASPMTGPAASGQVLAQAQGYQFTSDYFEKIVRFAEFLIAGRLSEAERQQALQECIAEFQQMPQAFLQTIEQIDAQMSQFYQIEDVAQLGLLRSMLVGQLNLAYQQMPPEQKPYLGRLIDQYTPVLAYDPSTQMALTWRDVEGYAGVFTFYLEIAGQPMQVSQQDLQALATTLTQQFQTATPEQKAALCAMSLYDEYLRNAWAQLTPQQQEQMRQQVVAQLAGMMQQDAAQPYGYGNVAGQPAYGYPGADQQPAGNYPTSREQLDAWLAQKQQEMQTNNFIFNSMQNMLMEQHATSLNIISNIGGGDDYWEVKYDW